MRGIIKWDIIRWHNTKHYETSWWLTISKGKELCEAFSFGFSICMNKDSKIRRSVENLLLPITLKLSIDPGTPHDNACCLIFGWGGTDKRDPVRKLLPACSATLVCRVRIVEPTYSDAQRAQLNLNTREDSIASGSLFLKLKIN